MKIKNLVTKIKDEKSLSREQAQTLFLMVKGQDFSSIGKRLKVSTPSVKFRVKAIHEKVIQKPKVRKDYSTELLTYFYFRLGRESGSKKVL